MTERKEPLHACAESADLARLEALDRSTPEGSRWYTLQCAEHIFHTLSPLDRRRKELTPDLLSRRMRENMDVRIMDASQLLPRDTVMELLACTAAAFHSIFQNPRTSLQKVTELRSPARLASMTPRTMRWLVRQPGRTYASKVAGKAHIPAERKVFSADTRENRFVRHLYQRLVGLAEGRYARIQEQLGDGGVSWDELTILRDFLSLRTQLRTSPLRDVPAQSCTQANNVLISDKEYSVLWRAGQRLDRYEKDLPRMLENIHGQVLSAVYVHLLETFFSRQNIYLLDWVNTIHREDGVPLLSDLSGQPRRAAHFVELNERGQACRWIQVACGQSGISTRTVSLVLDQKTMHYRANWPVQRTYLIELEDDDGYEGVPIRFTDQKGERWDRYGNLADIQAICNTICGDVTKAAAKRFPGPSKEPEALCLELGLERLYYLSAGEQAVRQLRSVPAGVSRDGERVCPADTDGFYLDTEQPVPARAVFDGGIKGARYFREAAGRLPGHGLSRAIYLMPDALSEFAQGPVRLALQGSFRRHYPVWRSIGAALFCAGSGMKEGLRPKVGERLAVVDLLGAGSITMLQYVRDDGGYPVFRKFPPRSIGAVGNALLPDFCRAYLQEYEKKYGWELPKETARTLLERGEVSNLLISGREAVVPVQGKKGLEWFHLGFDKMLHKTLSDRALHALRRAILPRKEDRNVRIVLLADHLERDFQQIHDILSVWPLRVWQKDVMTGALRVSGRLERGLTTWQERLPDLSLAIADGYYRLFPLVKDQQMEAGTGRQVIPAPAKFQLPAGASEIRLPLIMKDADAVSNISACLRGSWLPLPEPEAVSVSIHYDFSSENCYKLYFSPAGPESRMPQSVLAECVQEAYEVRPDREIVFNEAKWQPRDSAAETAEAFTKRCGQLLRLMEQILDPHNSKAEETLRYMTSRANVAGSHLAWVCAMNHYRDMAAVREAARQFTEGRLFTIFCDLLLQEKNVVTDQNFYVRFHGVAVENRPGTQILRKYAIRFLAALDNRLIGSSDFQRAGEIYHCLLYELPRTLPDGYVLSAVYRDMLRSQEDDIRVLRQVTALGRTKFQRNMERMLSALVWQSKAAISQIYSVDPQFIHNALQSCKNAINCAKRRLEGGSGELPRLPELRDYYELLLAILRLRSRSDFGLLKTGSREAVLLAREIRQVDAMLSERLGGSPDEQMKLRVGIQAEQPAHLRQMSKIAFILDTFLSGENGASAITLTGFDDLDG